MKRVRKLEDEFDRTALELLKVPKGEAGRAATRMRSRSFIGEEIMLDELQRAQKGDLEGSAKKVFSKKQAID